MDCLDAMLAKSCFMMDLRTLLVLVSNVENSYHMWNSIIENDINGERFWDIAVMEIITAIVA